jgi:hypothetical protein
MTRRIATLALAGALWSAVSYAQPVGDKSQTESVTVTGNRVREEVIRDFVKSYAGAAPALGKMAKWVRPICPVTTGLTQAMNTLVNDRVRAVAGMVGAPVAEKIPCGANIDIVFTRQPQALLDQVRKEHPVLLGFHLTAQAEKIAMVSHPIQAWYTTETEDEHGLRQIDDPQDRHGSDMIVPAGANPACPNGCTWHLPNARTVNVSGSRIADSLRSQFFHVMVVIDLDRISGLEIGSLADNIAVLALTQPQVFDACLTPPSITNLMTAECAKKPKALTEMDIAYLRAVYRLDTAKVFSSQKSEIAYQMKKALGGD